MPTNETSKVGGCRPPYYRLVHDEETGEDFIEPYLTAGALLGMPFLNKGTAFTPEERDLFGLHGLLPPKPLTLEEQLERIWIEYQSEKTDLERNIFMNALHDRNETAFFRFFQEHIAEHMPIVYTPVVGEAVKLYSRIYRRARGIYITYDDRHVIDDMLANWGHPVVDAICVTDSEAILGIGDQGVGGMRIPVSKLVVYTVCAGVNPINLLPIVLDVGTNNEALLKDDMYLGWRHERLRGEKYDELVELFVRAVKKRYPNLLLHWEDFGKVNARRLLDKYRTELCSFNDDIQGTAAVALAALITATKRTRTKFCDQRVVVYGAGTAGVGIADEIVSAMVREGMSETQALQRMWLLNSKGLLTDRSVGLEYFQTKYIRPSADTEGWKLDSPDRICLADVVRNVHPTMLIGTSTQPGSFTKDIVRDMAAHVERPIIFPLSNPFTKCEAAPADLLEWTHGRAVIATGTPYPDVDFAGRKLRIGNCNNAFCFPGIALGAIASQARMISDGMISAAGIAVADWMEDTGDALAPTMPNLDHVRDISHQVAIAVVKAAIREGHCEQMTDDEIERRIKAKMWPGKYYRYRLPTG